MKLLRKRVKELITEHKGLVAASVATGVSHSALSRIMSGEKTDALPETLAMLGLEHIPNLEIHRVKRQ